MGSRMLRSVRTRRLVTAALLGGLGTWLAGCGDDKLTGLGSPLRTPPDSLRSLTLRHLAFDSVYAVPVSTGRSGVAQVGSQYAYRAHVLYDFRIPTRVVRDADTLRLDEATLNIHTDSILTAPFTGSMRLRLQEVAVGARDWAEAAWIDSAINRLPELEPGRLARDTVLVGGTITDRAVRLAFEIDLAAVAGYDSVRTRGDTLDVNVALVFESFVVPGHGFLRYTFKDASGRQASLLNGFAAGEATAIASVAARRQRLVAEFDSTYSRGDKIVVSDGYRLHTFFKFPDLQTVLPDSALIYSAELVLTQTDTLDGTSFGVVSLAGIIVPRDTTISVYSKSANTKAPSFTAPLTLGPRSAITFAVTPYLLDQQERHVGNRGMILALSGEGTEVRHVEFYGDAASDSLQRPALRLIYGFPASFEGGRR